MAANRVNTEDVKKIFVTEVDDLDAFIDASHLIIQAKLLDSGLSEKHLTEIERWLAAHFAAVNYPRTISEKMGDAEERYYTSSVYSGKGSTGLDMTPYGRQVLLLDTSGKLRETFGMLRARFEAMGPVSEETIDVEA